MWNIINHSRLTFLHVPLKVSCMTMVMFEGILFNINNNSLADFACLALMYLYSETKLKKIWIFSDVRVYGFITEISLNNPKLIKHSMFCWPFGLSNIMHFSHNFYWIWRWQRTAFFQHSSTILFMVKRACC